MASFLDGMKVDGAGSPKRQRGPAPPGMAGAGAGAKEPKNFMVIAQGVRVALTAARKADSENEVTMIIEKDHADGGRLNISMEIYNSKTPKEKG